MPEFFPSVTPTTTQLPGLIRTTLAANFADPETPEGGALSTIVATATDGSITAGDIANPETPASNAVQTLIDSSLSAYSPSSAIPIRVFIDDNTSTTRPDWAGPVDWLTTVDTQPTNLRSSPPSGVAPDTWSLVDPAPVVPVLVWSDDFNRTNGTPLGTTAVGGKTWAETVAWQVIDNQAAKSAASGVRYATINGGLADGTLKATIALQGTDHVNGVVVRYVDTSNQIVLAARVSSSDFHYRIIKRVANVATTIATLTVLSADADAIEVTMSGTTLTFKINGTVGWTGTVAELSTATSHGLYGGTGTVNDARHDDASFWTLGY